MEVGRRKSEAVIHRGGTGCAERPSGCDTVSCLGQETQAGSAVDLFGHEKSHRKLTSALALLLRGTSLWLLGF